MVSPAAPTTASSKPRRTFVPQDLDLADFSKIEPLYQALLKRPVDSAELLEKWLADASELTAVIDEYGSRRYIDKSCHTDDAQIEKAYLHFVENVEPQIKPLHFALQQKYMQSPARPTLTARDVRYRILDRKWAADVELFREENVPLET